MFNFLEASASAPPHVPTIAERVAQGAATGSNEGGAIVPPGLSFAKAALPECLTGKNYADIARLHGVGCTMTRHVYHAPDGTEACAVLRVEDQHGTKSFRPLRCLKVEANGRTIFDLSAIPDPRPLYNLPALTQRPDAMVLLVEGEKAADAVATRFPAMVGSTWPNGAKSVGKADFRDLAGRNVMLWPDNDADGRHAMNAAAARLLAVGAKVSVVAVPESYPEKWDIADDDPVGLAPNLAPAALLLTARAIEGAAAEELLASLRKRKASTGSTSNAPIAGNLASGLSALRHLTDIGKRSLSGYGDWFASGCAMKHSYGEDGYDAWVTLSREYGDDTDDQYRRKWDGIEDRPDGEAITMATFFAEALATGWTDPAQAKTSNEEPRGSRADPASIVIGQSEVAGDQLWVDQFGKAHITLAVAGEDGVARTVHTRVGSGRHRGEMSNRYITAQKNKVLAADQEKRAILLLEHMARAGGAKYESANRAAMADGTIFVDLGRDDGKAVRVTAEGWEVVADVPVRFVRGSRGELPLPLDGGTLDDFLCHFNLGRDHVVRVVAFILAALCPLPSFPILVIIGRQGTAKSKMGDMILQLCDPPLSAKGGRMTMPGNEQALLIHATGVRVVYVDNISEISADDADSLCRLATGGGTVARKHYTDDEEVQINAVRPTIVTAIGLPTGRGDFLDRAVCVTALPIARRRTEEALDRAFAIVAPRMLGFVLSALAAALRNKAMIEKMVEDGGIALPRMADFGLWVEAGSEVLGLAPGEFSAELMGEQTEMQAEAAMGDATGIALARYFSADNGGHRVLEGTATEILETLAPFQRDRMPLPHVNKLRGALARIEPGLSVLGISYEIKEPVKGGRNRAACFRIAVDDAFVPIGGSTHF